MKRRTRKNSQNCKGNKVSSPFREIKPKYLELEDEGSMRRVWKRADKFWFNITIISIIGKYRANVLRVAT